MRQRIEAIDFWRGAALATIFINHIPGNLLGNLTPRNFGFSDSAEAFVFLSGLSVCFAHGGRFESGRMLHAALPLARRALRVYRAHIFLTAVALALFGGARALTGQESLLAEHGRGTVFADPQRGMLGVLTLGHQIGYFNILPLYVLLIALAPVLLILGRRSCWKMLGASAGLYALVRGLGLNAPSWPEPGGWYFNPMTWQFMFALGVFCGLVAKRGRLVLNAPAYWLAHGFTLAAAFIVSNGLGLFPGLVDAAGEHLDWDKTQLGMVRIIDFAALAYVIYGSGLTARLRPMFFYPALLLLGRHPLPVYCVGSVLSGIGQIVADTAFASPLFDVVFVASGLKCLHFLAYALEQRRQTRFVAEQVSRSYPNRRMAPDFRGGDDENSGEQRKEDRAGDNAEQAAADQGAGHGAERHHADKETAVRQHRETAVAAVAREADDHRRQAHGERQASRELDIHAEQQHECGDQQLAARDAKQRCDHPDQEACGDASDEPERPAG